MAGLLSLTLDVIQITPTYINGIRGASGTVQRFLQELENLKSVLAKIDDRSGLLVQSSVHDYTTILLIKIFTAILLEPISSFKRLFDPDLLLEKYATSVACPKAA